MDIVEIVQELLEYLYAHNGNRRTCDAMEEALELLKQDLPEEQRKREIKRVGDTISYLFEQMQQQEEVSLQGKQERKRFIEEVQRRLKTCCEECSAMAERKSMEQTPLVQEFENEFLTEMNAKLNGKNMTERENFSQLVYHYRMNLESRIRSVIREFTKSTLEEFDYCMEKIRMTFSKTQIGEYRTDYQKMEKSILMNYDSMQNNILAESDAYEYPSEPFSQFTDEIGTKMEKMANKERRITLLIELIPLIFLAAKYIFDNYIFPKETLVDQIVAILVSWLEKHVDQDFSVLFNVVQILLQFAQEHEEAFALTTEFLLIFFFFGWLYYIYLKIVRHIRQSSLYKKQQAMMRPAAEHFLRELNIREEIRKTLTEKVQSIAERYMQQHRCLFEKFMDEDLKDISENPLKKIMDAYEEYIRRGFGGL